MNQMGHNNPPLTPYETALAEISSLFEEAQNWLDGEPVENQGTADKLSRLLNEVRAARKRADDARKAAAKPFDGAKKEIQDRYNPLLKQADLATDACKKAMTPWLEKLEAEKRAAEIEARRIADEMRKEAEEAARSAAADDLVARQDAEAKIKPRRTPKPPPIVPPRTRAALMTEWARRPPSARLGSRRLSTLRQRLATTGRPTARR